MTTAIKRRRGTTTQHSTFTGLEAELTVDTTKKTVVVHDGSTAGGIPLAKEAEVVKLTGDQTISGVKTFSSTITSSISGNAGTVTNGVYTVGDQTVDGVKTLTSNPILSSGTTNGVAYLDGSGVLTTGSGLVFDGTNLSLNAPGAIISARVDPRVSTFTSTVVLIPDIQVAEQYNLTAQNEALSITAPTGSPADGNKILFRILDNGTPQAITWNATYTAIGAILPTTTTANKMTYVGCVYNSTNMRWDVVAVTTQV